jgi:hypothetical protein
MNNLTVGRRTFLGAMAGAMGLAAAAFGQSGAETKPLTRRSTFSFLHSYESTGRYWKGIEKAGLLRPGTGVRLVNSPFGEDNHRFNTSAALGSPLHAYLSEHKPIFVVDRIAGGSPYNAYAFDEALVRAYIDLLGDHFLGGQVHETISNVHNDWGRFKKANAEKAAQPINPDDFKAYFDWSNAERWLEYGILEDYRGRSYPADEAAFWAEFKKAAQRQGARFAGRFSYAEGTGWGELAWPAFYKFGAASCFVEVGPWASAQTQFSIASARGAARAAGKPWGVFFAPWGPDGCTSWVKPEDSSWQAPKKSLDESGWPVGPDKGPSSALQRRIFFHTYLSGAHTLHEEWGAEGNLSDLDAGTLSSYGKVTEDLLDFQDAHPDVGEPFTPIALVAEAVVPPNPAPWAPIKKAIFATSAFDNAQAARPAANKAEAVCYPPMALPEVFDVVPSDAPPALMQSYSTVIPASQENAVALLSEAVDRLCPFRRASSMPMQINRRLSDGAWILGLYNPWGATRGDVDNTGSVLDPECAQHDRIETKAPIDRLRVLHAWPEGTTAQAKDNTIKADLAPGATLVLEVILKP